MTIDWLTASREDRQTLYRVVKRKLDESSLSWRDLYRDALGQSYAPGHGYEDNFRAGRIGRKAAHRIAGWLHERHPAQAARLDILLSENDASAEAWERFLATRGDWDRLSMLALPDANIGIVAFAKASRRAVTTLRLGDRFCFSLDSLRDGVALALQSIDARWYALPLGLDGLTAHITRGQQHLPRKADGTILPLSEDSHVGRHRFALLIGDADDFASLGNLPLGLPIEATTLNHIAVGWREADAVMRVDGLFVA